MNNEQLFNLFKKSEDGYTVSIMSYGEYSDDYINILVKSLEEAVHIVRQRNELTERVWVSNNQYEFEYEYSAKTGLPVNTSRPKPVNHLNMAHVYDLAEEDC